MIRAFDHTSFTVDDIEAVVDALAAGGSAKLAEVTLCASGPVADCLAIYMKGPRGRIVELVEESGH